MSRRAAIYARISRDRNGEQLGVTRQREDCEKLATDRGWQVAATYTDNDTSAYDGTERPGYAAMLDAIRAGEVDAILAWHPDRLHRSPRDLEDFVDLVEGHAIEVATVRAGDLDLSTASGRMTARIVGSVARHESEQRSERVRRALEQRARAGKRHGSGRPFGYERDGVTIRETEAEAIREAADRVLAGEPWHRIVRDWNAAGLRPPQGARQWSPTNWRRMMVAPTLAGLAHYKGEVVGQGQWEPILDRQTWERLVATLSPKRRAGRPATHLLTGIARCGRCGHPLWFASRSGRPTYRCYKGEGRNGCGGTTIAAEATEALVRDLVLAALAGPELAEARRRAAGDDRRQAKAADDLTDAEARLDELAGDFADGTISRREWLAARGRLEERITDARRVLDSNGNGTLADLPSDADALRAAWDAHEDDVDWRRALVAAVIDRIDVQPATKLGPKLDPDRVVTGIVWRT